MSPTEPMLKGSDDISAHNMSISTEVLDQMEVPYHSTA